MSKVQSKKPAKSAKKSNDDSFVSDDVVSSGASAYLKLNKADKSKFRIISKPIIGWLSWEENKPIRTHIDDEPEVIDDENPPKKFMTMVVIDRDDNQVKILEITQQSIIKAIKALAANDDWGQPFAYDINVTKTGEGLKTKYAVQPSPKKVLEKELQKAAMAKRCNLDVLFDGGDPWSVEDGEETELFFK